MRTAITMVKTHAGKWKTLKTPDDSIIDQKKEFRALSSFRSHAEFAKVLYQESDGYLETRTFLTPEEDKKQSNQRAQVLEQIKEEKKTAEAPRVEAINQPTDKMKTKLNTKRGGAFALAASTAIMLLCFCLPAHAGQQSQGDTNTMVAATTNTFILSGDVSGTYTNGQQPSGSQLLNCSQAAGVWLECGGFYTNSGAGASNITFRIAGSVSATQWTNNIASVVVSVPVGTNWASGDLFISNVTPFLGLRAIENVNTGNVAARGNTQYIKAFVKPGI